MKIFQKITKRLRFTDRHCINATFKKSKITAYILTAGPGSGPWGEWGSCPTCKLEGEQTVQIRTRDCAEKDCETDSKPCDDPPEFCRKYIRGFKHVSHILA